MAALIVAWLATKPSVEVAWAPVIVAVPTTVVVPRAVFVFPAPAPAPTAAPTIVMIEVARIAGIIRAWVIEALA